MLKGYEWDCHRWKEIADPRGITQDTVLCTETANEYLPETARNMHFAMLMHFTVLLIGKNDFWIGHVIVTDPADAVTLARRRFAANANRTDDGPFQVCQTLVFKGDIDPAITL